MDDYVTALSTGYHPVDEDDPEYKMEGGRLDREGNPIYTLDQFMAGNAPYVTVAMDSSALPYGTSIASPDFPGVPFQVRDTGSAFKGKGLSRVDIARDTSAGANAPENNKPFRFTVTGGANIGNAGLRGLAAPDQMGDLMQLKIGEPLQPSGFGPPGDSLTGINTLSPVGSGDPVTDFEGNVIGQTGESEDTQDQSAAEDTTMPMPTLKGPVQVVKKNPDGTYELSDHTTYNPIDGSKSWGFHGRTVIRFRDGSKKIFKDAERRTPEQISDEKAAEKNVRRPQFPPGPEGDKQYDQAKTALFSTERKSLTEMQIKGAAYYQRASDAAQRAEEVLKKYDPKSFRMDTDLLLRDKPVARRMVSDNSKRLFPIIEEFTNAVLRRDSGAAVTNIEMKRAMERYFPVPGDTPEAVAEKARNRKVTMDSLKTGVPEGVIRNVDGSVTPSIENNEAKRKAGLKWLEDNPNDSRAEEIRRRLELLP